MTENENRILIAGTFSNDLESGRRMQWALESFKPDIIIGETNQLLDIKASTREMMWAILFDECEIPVDVQEKWKAIQTHKEHIAAYDYSTAEKILYFMLDVDSKFNQKDVALYAQTKLLKELQAELDPEEIRRYIREVVERKFNQHQKNQHGEPYCEKYYSDKSLCKERSLYHVDERGENLAREVKIITRKYRDARIFGFFQGTQIVKPDSIWATQILDRSMHNVRYHLGEKGIQYSQLVDLI